MEFFGQILDIDLSSGSWKFVPFLESRAQKYLGGRGLNVKFLYENLPAGIDPLGPDNILTFSCGLLTGTAAPASARLHINALSPLTGLLGSSNVGGAAGAWGAACWGGGMAPESQNSRSRLTSAEARKGGASAAVLAFSCIRGGRPLGAVGSGMAAAAAAFALPVRERSSWLMAALESEVGKVLRRYW